MSINTKVVPLERPIPPPAASSPALPATGFIRLENIIGNKRKGITALFPVCASSWWAGVKSGRYPEPVKLSERCTAWRVEDIRALIEQTARG